MKIEFMLPGLALFAVGFVVFFVLLASVGALAKSKQFAAIGALASGASGSGKRTLFFISLLLLVTGALGTFAGVAASDGERARACTALCVSRGNISGRIGAATTPDPKRPQPACLCEGGAPSWETPADTLTF